MIWLLLLGSLVAILIAAEFFTNALEHLGERLGISEGVTGSLFAAVGTAMPETMVPVLALMAGSGDAELNEEIGVGAIIGAPLMLATLVMSLTGLAVLRLRGLRGPITPELSGFRRDLNVFLVAFGIAGLALLIPADWIHAGLTRALVASVLIFIYFLYVLMTLRSSSALVEQGHGTEAHHDMFLARLGLPENINSVLWIRRRKDTLAMGNITGAMVFQGTTLPALGLMLTSWQPQTAVVAAFAVTGLGAVWLRLQASGSGLKVWHLGVSGLLYVAFVVMVLVV